MNKKQAYRWQARCHRAAKEAQVVGEEIERIRRASGGSFKPEDLVNAARSKRSPLHRFFEWDNTKAAEAWRKFQARKLVRDIVVDVQTADMDEPVTMRAFSDVERDVEPKFTNLHEIMTNPDYREEVVARAKQELVMWRARYRDLKELSHIFEALDSAG